jgi:hypothetical protein
VPRISAFYGIVIWMYFNDHNPPHFHATYSGAEVLMTIRDLAILRGMLPTRALGLVEEWAREHREDLLADWERARAGEPLLPIQPLA